jgi:hypothetical protein
MRTPANSQLHAVGCVQLELWRCLIHTAATRSCTLRAGRCVLGAACWALRAGRCVRSTRRQQAAGLAGALFGLAFARAASLGQGLSPPPQGGHSPAHSSRGTPSGRSPCPFQPAQRPAPRQGIPPEGSGHRRTGPGKGQQPSDSVWADDFRFCFTPLAGVLFTVPSRYWCTIGRLSGYVALERGRPSFPQGSSCPVVLTHPPPPARLVVRLRGSHPLWPAVPGRSPAPAACVVPAG